MAYNEFTASIFQINETRKKLERMRYAKKILKDKNTVMWGKMFDTYKNMELFREKISIAARDANMAATSIRYFNSEFKTFVLANPPSIAKTYLIHKRSDISNQIHEMELIHNGPEPFNLAGLSMGGQQINETKKEFRDYIELLIDDLNCRNRFVYLEAEYKLTVRKINVIEKLIIPRLQEAIVHMTAVLDDFEREDLYRIKKAKHNMRRKAKSEREYRRASIMIEISERNMRRLARERELQDLHIPIKESLRDEMLNMEKIYTFMVSIILAIIAYILFKYMN